MVKKTKNAIEAMELLMSSESVQRARMKAEQEILAIKLSQLRRKYKKAQRRSTDLFTFGGCLLRCQTHWPLQ